jgi:hypothetical protein
MRKDVKATDIKYDKKVINKGTVVLDNDRLGGIDRTIRVPTSYEKNYNADFKLTKQDIKNIQDGKITNDIAQKLADDLYVLDNHPDWKLQNPDIDTQKSIEMLGEDFNDNYYINQDGDLVDGGKVLFSAKKIEDRYISKKGNILEKQIKKDATPFRDVEYSIENFNSEFPNGRVDTPIGEAIIDNNQFNKLSDNIHNEDRTKFFGLIKPTLEDPVFIVDFEDVTMYFKPFVDKRSKITRFVSVTKDKNGKIFVKSNYDINRDNKFKMILKHGELKYSKFNDGDTGYPPQTPSNESIPNKQNKSQGDIVGNTQNKKTNRKDVDNTTTKSDSATNGRNNNNADDGGDTSFGGANI